MPTPQRYVALLRGINVGRAKRVAMADLRDLVAGLGHADVRTLLNSGNVVFSGRSAPVERIAAAIEQALERGVGVRANVTVLGADAFRTIVSENPLPAAVAEPSRFLVGFLRDPVAARPALAPLLERRWDGDAFALGARAAYLWCAGGILESELLDAVGRLLGDQVTTRNWATVTKVLALL